VEANSERLVVMSTLALLALTLGGRLPPLGWLSDDGAREGGVVARVSIAWDGPQAVTVSREGIS
jgi:hypothetical protein